MKILPILLASLLISPASVGDFFDPMQPPTFALNKFRLQKMKDKPRVKPVPRQQQKSSPWVLSSVLYSDQRKHAIINNRLVRQGETIKGARLIRIRPTGVQLKSKGKLIELTLRKRIGAIRKSSSEKKL